ncbi:MAG: hypothetical protein V3R87_09295, partial [Dehalococcoidia bacterium]
FCLKERACCDYHTLNPALARARAPALRRCPDPIEPTYSDSPPSGAMAAGVVGAAITPAPTGQRPGLLRDSSRRAAGNEGAAPARLTLPLRQSARR